jgi:hypothetical protein
MASLRLRRSARPWGTPGLTYLSDLMSFERTKKIPETSRPAAATEYSNRTPEAWMRNAPKTCPTGITPRLPSWSTPKYR